jgi:predicted 3-demethylubiquinone-9 3-methyltransferase (glyoxalase superfamily)
MTVSFELEGQEFIALNGGPEFSFTPAISFSIDCETQAEVDTFWERLSEGGKPGQCGWLEDKFGVSWQVVPSVLPDLLRDESDEKSEAVMHAMLQMTKLDLETLREATAEPSPHTYRRRCALLTRQPLRRDRPGRKLRSA